MRNSTWSNEHSNPIADHESIRVINLEPFSSMQFHCENLKRIPQLKNAEDAVEIFNCHCRSLWE